MSRSSRREPVSGLTAAASEKEWKRQANRKLRKASAQAVAAAPDADGMVLPVIDEVADVWSSPKEGKSRFDPSEQPKRMRK